MRFKTPTKSTTNLPNILGVLSAMQSTKTIERNARTSKRRTDDEMEAVRVRRGKLNKVQRQARHNWESAE